MQVPLSNLVAVTNEHTRPVSAARTYSPTPEERSPMSKGAGSGSSGAPKKTGTKRPGSKKNLKAQSFAPPRAERRQTGGMTVPQGAIEDFASKEAANASRPGSR